MKSPVITTKRLVLRPFYYRDAMDAFALCSNPETSRYALWEPHATLFDSLRYIYWTHRKSEGMHWALVLDGRVIGSCSFVCFNREENSAELGYSLLPDFWGQGLATEAAEAVAKYGFSKLRLDSVYVRIMLENTRSLSVAKNSRP